MLASIHRTCRRVGLALAVTLGTTLVGSCGGGGGDSGASSSAPNTTSTTAPTVAQLANICTLAGEKAWIAAYLNDAYLFYRDIVAVNPTAYATQEDYFYALLVRSKDRFSFVEPQTVADAFFTAGQDVGYGAIYKLDAANALRIGFVDAGGPFAAQNVGRGATVTALNGTATAALTSTQLNALLFPTTTGVSLSVTVIDASATTPRTIALVSTSITEDPVPLARILPAPTGSPSSAGVGYLLFNDHIATSESKLADAIALFKAAGVSDVIVDLRYNGGGYLYIASELAYMLGGSRIPSGAAFEKLQYNDKHPEKNSTEAFLTTTINGQALPTLNLSRVFVVTAPGTCSASESVINGLTPFLSVIRIGGTTCGKPYGFIQANNCGDAFFAIQFQGVNSAGFGDYSNGFSPTCAVADDFSHALGDPAEGRLAATLGYSVSGTCPTSSVAADALAKSTSRDGIATSAPTEAYIGRPHRRVRLLD